MKLDAGFEISLVDDTLRFAYGQGVFGPEPEFRTLDAIRPSLMEPACSGPEQVYGIVMDVGRDEDKAALEERMLLVGAVAYARGTLGREPVRSQGHVHAIAPHSGWSPPELFEIWSGTAIVFTQEFTEDAPGRCFAVVAEPGQHVVAPPGWAHCVINADVTREMTFGAFCDRQYGFVYDGVRRHHGLAHFPVVRPDHSLDWIANPHYQPSQLIVRRARAYPELGLREGVPMYRQFLDDPSSVAWVSDPARYSHLWPGFEP